METLIKLTAIVLIGCMLTGCSKSIDVTTLTYGKSNKKEVMDMFGTRASRKFYFRVHEKNYSFLKYPAPDSHDNVGFLFEDDKLIAANKSKEWWSVFGYDTCIVFPLSHDDNIHECFLEVTNDFIATRHPLETLTFTPHDNDAFETFAYTLEFATYAAVGYPILMVGAAFMPIFLVDYWHCAETQEELAAELQLGEPMGKHAKLLDDYPGHIISRNRRNASMLIPAGFLFKQPAYSVGMHDGEIIWLDEQPYGMCDSGFSIQGCKLGNPRSTAENRGYTNKNTPYEENIYPWREEDYGEFWETSY